MTLGNFVVGQSSLEGTASSNSSYSSQALPKAQKLFALILAPPPG